MHRLVHITIKLLNANVNKITVITLELEYWLPLSFPA